MRKILLFACDPGGANVIMPLITPLQETWQVSLWGKGTALKHYALHGLEGFNIDLQCVSADCLSISAFLRSQAPDMIVTGTSANDFAEKYLWKAAHEFGIPSIAIIDQWVNYGIRFSAYPVLEINSYLETMVHQYMPDKIGVIDTFVRDEMLASGFLADQLFIAGHPYLEIIMQTMRVTKKRSHNIDSANFVIAFFSEPVSQMYGDDKYWGYTEKSVLKDLVMVLNKIATNSLKSVKLIIKIHPREAAENHEWIFNECLSFTPEIIKDSSSWEIFQKSDLICGMASMALIEAAVLELPVLSIQTGLTREDPCVLSRRGVVSCATNRTMLEVMLTSIILDKMPLKSRFDVGVGATKNVIREIEELYANS